MKTKILFIIGIIFFSGCNKNEANNSTELTDPQLIARLDSMLSLIGVSSYSDILSGKLEGNFYISANYYPYDANCSTVSIPFKLNTQLSGSISLDSNNRTNLINAGDLYINYIKIVPTLNASNQYVYYSNPENTIELDKIYGKTNTIRLIKGDSIIINTSLFLPKNIIMTDVIDCTTGESLITLKPGFKLTWNPDKQNRNGVVIELLGRDNTGVERYTYVLVSDNGYYYFTENNLNKYPKTHNPFGIEVKLLRGNFIFIKGLDGRRYQFTFATSCKFLIPQ